MSATVYLIPCILADNATDCIPTYVIDAVKKCSIIYAENERTARRYLKMMDKAIIIDDYEWHTIGKVEGEMIDQFTKSLLTLKSIGIISEAGCPGIADPGQALIATAQKLNATIHPLVGPSSILLSLMASGMNGQQFEFVGYLPIDNAERIKRIKELEASSQKNNSTKIFIETPYRNDQLLASLLKVCNPNTRLCVALNITAATESILTRTIAEWRQNIPTLHKQTAIFLLHSS